MSENNFDHLVNEYFQRTAKVLTLSAPVIKRQGNITTATMKTSAGHVEMRCGPAEYHVEIFICADGKRWTLADLISIETVRAWLQDNRSNTTGKSRLEAEVETAFGLLSDGLQDVETFAWLFS